MNLGFTGSQRGMTDEQRQAFVRLIAVLHPHQFHHGDCVGSDATAALIVRASGCRIIGHPPSDDKKRAFFRSDETLEPAPYMERNEAIVKACEILIATPSGSETSQPRSGTWATVRRARAAGKPVKVIYPDGRSGT